MSKKKIIIISSIILLITIAIICCVIYVLNKNNSDNYTTLTSTDGKFTINLSNSIKYKINSLPDNDFTIDLYSEEDNMFMYATTIEKKRELDLYEITQDDKTSYFEDKENIRDDTGITQTKVDGNNAYEYSLVYFDSKYNKDFYCHVVWIETENYIYVLNFEVINENADKYSKEFIKIQNSFKEL